MDNQPNDQTSVPVSPPGARIDSQDTEGCWQASLLVFLVVWVLFTTAVAQAASFIAEQSLTSGAAGSDWRWLISLLYGLAILVPAAAGLASGKVLRARHVFVTFLLAGGFAVLQVPARLVGITHAYEIALLQITGILVFLLLQRRGPRLEDNRSGIWLALLSAGLVSIPWVLWGAMGSVVDVLLNLIVALLFGLAASRVLRRRYARPPVESSQPRNTFQEGFHSWLALLVMATALGVTGIQGLLSLAFPGLGWALAALYNREPRPDGRQADNANSLALLVGLAAFWPLAFVDADEMAVVLSFGLTQLAQWANLAALVSLGIGLLISLVLVMQVRTLLRVSPVLGAGAALLVWLVAASLYVFSGQPGLYGERLFVILKDQADLSEAALVQPYQERRSAVYQLLVEKAVTSQAEIRLQLDRWGVPYRSYYLQNALEVQGGPLVRIWLERRPEVDRVLDNPILRPLPEPVPESSGSNDSPSDTPWNLKMIGADRVWSEFRVTGAGIIVGQSDSGVQGDHPELADSYRGQQGKNDFNWYDPWNGSQSPVDVGGHGTHTLATAVGNRVGVAPDAEWIGCVNLARNLGNPGYYLSCLEFLLAPFPMGGDPQLDGRPELGAHVLNNSWGCPPIEGCDSTALLPAVVALRAAGVFVVASAGNDGDGGCSSVAHPISLYAQVYSVGAVDSGMELASFSSIGPVEADGSQRTKPDISAPGVDVLSAYPGGTYSTASGTSMAGPHVAGVVALMWSANPTLIGDIDLTQQLLNETATAYNGWTPACVAPGQPNNATGYGILNAYDAVRRAIGE